MSRHIKNNNEQTIEITSITTNQPTNQHTHSAQVQCALMEMSTILCDNKISKRAFANVQSIFEFNLLCVRACECVRVRAFESYIDSVGKCWAISKIFQMLLQKNKHNFNTFYGAKAARRDNLTTHCEWHKHKCLAHYGRTCFFY